MTAADVSEVVDLADRVIGDGYYDPATVRELIERATTEVGCLSYVARTGEGALIGFRFTLPPGRWRSGRGSALHPERWPAPLDRAAYFQSCFVDPGHMGKGIGKGLARRALDALPRTGAELVVAHSWKESPHGSSRRYLEALGFSVVAESPDYWVEVDYCCPRCGRPCRCTALEMVLQLGER
jgi:L-amino acid N-acyltransferase YncA